jgi:DNA (cytosine-5)-methyltransferase 1
MYQTEPQVSLVEEHQNQYNIFKPKPTQLKSDDFGCVTDEDLLMNEHSLKAIDLFCGIGGFRLALNKLGVKNVFSSDIDKYAQATYAHNFGETPAGDITKTAAADIPNFDILTAGFPCQPFSYSGKNQGFEDKTRGTLFFDICRILEHHKPAMFLLENVKGLKSHNNGETVQIIKESLEKLDYKVKAHVFSSLDFGLPQARERWYCVGFREDIKVDFDFPENTTDRDFPKLKAIIEPNLNDSKLRLPQFEIDRIHYHFKNAHRNERIQHDASKYEAHTKKGKHGIFSFQKPDGALRFHVGDFAKTQIQEAFYACVNTYAPTIIAGRVPKLWDLERKLSVLEAQRLQGFPDTFTFPVSDNQAYKQLGNSVSVPVVYAILHEMVKSYNLSKSNQK